MFKFKKIFSFLSSDIKAYRYLQFQMPNKSSVSIVNKLTKTEKQNSIFTYIQKHCPETHSLSQNRERWARSST
ncbi:hypothetical protein IJO12_03360 [bacterium]|nr:hypothetical protein [bacterium]